MLLARPPLTQIGEGIRFVRLVNNGKAIITGRQQIIEGIISYRLDFNLSSDMKMVIESVKPGDRNIVSLGIKGVRQTNWLRINGQFKGLESLPTVVPWSQSQLVWFQKDRARKAVFCQMVDLVKQGEILPKCKSRRYPRLSWSTRQLPQSLITDGFLLGPSRYNENRLNFSCWTMKETSLLPATWQVMTQPM